MLNLFRGLGGFWVNVMPASYFQSDSNPITLYKTNMTYINYLHILRHYNSLVALRTRHAFATWALHWSACLDILS